MKSNLKTHSATIHNIILDKDNIIVLLIYFL